MAHVPQGCEETLPPAGHVCIASGTCIPQPPCLPGLAAPAHPCRRRRGWQRPGRGGAHCHLLLAGPQQPERACIQARGCPDCREDTGGACQGCRQLSLYLQDVARKCLADLTTLTATFGPFDSQRCNQLWCGLHASCRGRACVHNPAIKGSRMCLPAAGIYVLRLMTVATEDCG